MNSRLIVIAIKLITWEGSANASMGQKDNLCRWLKSNRTRLKGNFRRGSDLDENKSAPRVLKDGKGVWQLVEKNQWHQQQLVGGS